MRSDQKRASGVTKGGVAYSYAGPVAVAPRANKDHLTWQSWGDRHDADASRRASHGITKGGVSYSYSPAPTITSQPQPPASRSANPRPSPGYYNRYGAPTKVIYHYATPSNAPHARSPPPPQLASGLLPPPPHVQYAPPPPHLLPPPLPLPPYAPHAPLQQYALVNTSAGPPVTLQTIHPPVYHPARGGRVFTGRIVGSRQDAAPLQYAPLQNARGLQGQPAPQGSPRQDAPLQYAPLQYAPLQDAPGPQRQPAPQGVPMQDALLQYAPLQADAYDHAAVRAATSSILQIWAADRTLARD